MIDVGRVQGSKAMAIPVVVGFNTVYVHTDIKKLPDDPETGSKDLYSYNEVQYNKDEYIGFLNQKIEALNIQNDFQEECLVEIANVVYA